VWLTSKPPSLLSGSIEVRQRLAPVLAAESKGRLEMREPVPSSSPWSMGGGVAVAVFASLLRIGSRPDDVARAAPT